MKIEDLGKEQQAIIKSRDRSVLVSAGAGSGKTFILIQRLMSFLNPADLSKAEDIDRFLIITYTKAAAGELRARIIEALSEAISDVNKEADSAEKRQRLNHLKRQNALVGRAPIGTIHSFCSSVLREFGGKLNVRPDFRVIEGEKEEKLRAEVLDRVLDDWYAHVEEHPGFRELADTVGNGRDDKKLTETVESLSRSIQCHARPADWIEEQKARYASCPEDPLQTDWGKALAEETLLKLKDYRTVLESLQKMANVAEKKIQQNTGLLTILLDAIDSIEKAMDVENGGTWDQIRGCVPDDFGTLKTMNQAENQKLAASFKQWRDDCKGYLRELKEKVYADPAEEIMSGLKETFPAMEALLDLTADFLKTYHEAKRENGLVDFSDLEHFAAELLTNEDGSPTEAAAVLSRRYTEIMVDEYQDVSRVQDAIFRTVSRNGENLFFVGDLKQGIYRFRLAEPKIFEEKIDSWTPYGEADSEVKTVKIPLTKNFRSRGTVIDAVNSIFESCMSKYLGNVDYTQKENRLVCGAEYAEDQADRKAELFILEKRKTDGEGDSPNKVRDEATAVAQMIRELVNSGVTVGKSGKERRIRYSDVAILLRSVKNTENIYRSELEKAGIPLNSGAGGFYESREITWLTSLLSVIDNPHKDVPLLAVLRSPAFGFTPDDLAAVRGAASDTDLYSALTIASESSELCADFLQKLKKWRDAAVGCSISELVWSLLTETELLALCAAMPDGETRRARLLKFVELAQKFEDDGYRGIHAFVRWLARMEKKGDDPGISAEAEAGVTITTIHKSKGLEYPVVFLCQCGKQFNEEDLKKSVLIHPDLGLGPDVFDLERRVKYPSLAKTAIKAKMRREGRSEEMRLLYVALTRAEERLYITGTVDDRAKFNATARAAAVNGKLSPAQLGSKITMLAWLAEAAEQDKGSIIKQDYEMEKLLAWQEKHEEQGDFTPDEQEVEKLRQSLEQNLAFRYAYGEAAELPSKLTATELKHGEPLVREEEYDETHALLKPTEEPLPYVLRMPDFTLKDRKLSGAEKGTATHLVLQHLDYGKTGSLAEIEEEIHRLLEQGFLTEPQALAADPEAILGLFRSELGRRMKNAPKLRREFRFSLLCRAEELLHCGGEEEILLQGVVDCFLEEPDGITVIDYKTDRVKTPEEVSARAEYYRSQVEAYRMALGRICDKPVKECVLYFLTPGMEVSLS